MQRSALAAIFLCSLMVLTPLAEAQRPGGGGRGRPGGGFGGGGPGGPLDIAMLVGLEQVQQEIGLEGEKLEAVKKLLEEQRASVQAGFGDFGNFRELSDEERQKAFAEMREKREQASKKTSQALAEHLSKEQMTRLEQIQLQIRGIRALDDDDVVAKLEINEEQQLKIAEALEKQEAEGRKLMEEVRSAGREGGREAFAAIREKVEALQAEAEEQVLALLTAAQKEKWNSLTGKKFELDRSAMFGRGRGGFGGRGDRGAGGRGAGGRGQRPAADE